MSNLYRNAHVEGILADLIQAHMGVETREEAEAEAIRRLNPVDRTPTWSQCVRLPSGDRFHLVARSEAELQEAVRGLRGSGTSCTAPASEP